MIWGLTEGSHAFVFLRVQFVIHHEWNWVFFFFNLCSLVALFFISLTSIITITLFEVSFLSFTPNWVRLLPLIEFGLTIVNYCVAHQKSLDLLLILDFLFRTQTLILCYNLWLILRVKVDFFKVFLSDFGKIFDIGELKVLEQLFCIDSGFPIPQVLQSLFFQSEYSSFRNTINIDKFSPRNPLIV